MKETSITCSYCRLPIKEHIEILNTTHGIKYFCCYGCSSAFSLINHNIILDPCSDIETQKTPMSLKSKLNQVGGLIKQLRDTT